MGSTRRIECFACLVGKLCHNLIPSFSLNENLNKKAINEKPFPTILLPFPNFFLSLFFINFFFFLQIRETMPNVYWKHSARVVRWIHYYLVKFYLFASRKMLPVKFLFVNTIDKNVFLGTFFLMVK